jgi:uncharacterized protein (TIGR00369 family)
MTPEEFLAFGRKVLASQPFSRFLGAELADFREGYAELQLAIRPELLQQHGFVHGGVLSYLADNAITFVGGSVLGGANVVTSEYKINYVRPAVGARLIARATVIYNGKRQAVCQCEVEVVQDGNPRLCAVAQGTITVLESEK